MDKYIIEELVSLPSLELFVLYYDIKHIIEDKEISEETIFHAIRELKKCSSLQYHTLTYYLENKGYKRETISKKILDLIGVGKIDFVQSWSTELHPIYEGKEHVEIGFIYFPEEDKIGDFIKELFQKAKERQKVEKEKEKLYELSMDALLDLQESIKIILNGREIDTDTVSYVIRHLCKIYHNSVWIRYTKLTLFLEKAGFRRESISRELINMVRKGLFNFSTDFPIREEKETPENPIFTLINGRPIVNIYCKEFREKII